MSEAGFTTPGRVVGKDTGRNETDPSGVSTTYGTLIDHSQAHDPSVGLETDMKG